MNKPELIPVSELHQEYLHDESRLAGQADFIAFPENVQQAAQVLAYADANQLPITVQGSRTGICGGAVPNGGIILNLSKMNHIGPVMGNAENGFTIQVEAGALCQDIAAQLNRSNLFFPPDPTETTATIGGMFSHNAKGICSYRYGTTADYVQGVTLLQHDGTPLTIARGQCVFDQNGCTLPDGRTLSLTDLPQASSLPCLPACGMDLLDLLAGSEGMLGVVVLLTLRVLPAPEEPWGIVFFYPDAMPALELAESIRQKAMPEVCCAEFFDSTALSLIEQCKQTSNNLKIIPDFPAGSHAALYIELSSDDPDALEGALVDLLTSFEEQGNSQEQSWAVSGRNELEKFHLMRHTVPEAVNMQIDRLRQQYPHAHKFGLDFSCPALSAPQLYQLYQNTLEQFGLNGVVFGHAASRHLHFNLLPANQTELDACPQLIAQLSREIMSHDGVLCTENGVGKLKADTVRPYLCDSAKNTITAIRSFFDPNHILNPNNMPL